LFKLYTKYKTNEHIFVYVLGDRIRKWNMAYDSG